MTKSTIIYAIKGLVLLSLEDFNKIRNSISCFLQEEDNSIFFDGDKYEFITKFPLIAEVYQMFGFKVEEIEVCI